jgi:FixJ family two-component response regulator
MTTRDDAELLKLTELEQLKAGRVGRLRRELNAIAPEYQHVRERQKALRERYRPIVRELHSLGVAQRDIAADLGVSREAIRRAVGTGTTREDKP